MSESYNLYSRDFRAEPSDRLPREILRAAFPIEGDPRPDGLQLSLEWVPNRWEERGLGDDPSLWDDVDHEKCVVRIIVWETVERCRPGTMDRVEVRQIYDVKEQTLEIPRLPDEAHEVSAEQRDDVLSRLIQAVAQTARGALREMNREDVVALLPYDLLGPRTWSVMQLDSVWHGAPTEWIRTKLMTGGRMGRFLTQEQKERIL